MAELARAKVNLSLHVVGRRADSYHLLDSIVVFPEVGDELRREGMEFRISGPFAEGVPLAGNLVTRAADLLGVKPVIHLVKNLPVASGIGGGSADAAAALRLLAKDAVPDGTPLGADVPACLISKPLRMQGIGEKLTRLTPLPDYAMVLVNNGEPVSTPQVFKALKTTENPESPPMPAGLDAAGFFAFIAAQRNDMQSAAISICPGIADVLAALAKQPDCALARMSGSGGTCFGLFATLEQAERAAGKIRQAHPEWWVVAARA